MWFLPRVSAIGVLAILVGAILLFALDLDAVAYIISGVICAVLLLGIVFDLYEGPKK